MTHLDPESAGVHPDVARAQAEEQAVGDAVDTPEPPPTDTQDPDATEPSEPVTDEEEDAFESDDDFLEDIDDDEEARPDHVAGADAENQG